MKSKKNRAKPLGFGMELVRSGIEVKGGDISPPGCGCIPSDAVLFGYDSSTECACGCGSQHGEQDLDKALQMRIPITGYIECP